MPFLEWQDKYNVGVAAIDEQHQAIFAMINNLYESLNKGVYNSGNVGSVLIPIAECIKYHFQTEEKLMMEINFPEYHCHKTLHERLTEPLMAFIIKLKKNEKVDINEFLGFIKEWFLAHISAEDIKIARAMIPAQKSPARVK